MTNLQVKAIIVGVLLLAMAGIAWQIHDAGYQAGVDSEKAASGLAVAQAQSREVIKVKEVILWKEKIKVVYRDKIKTIRLAADPTGCLGHDLRAVGLGGMLRTSSDTP